MARPLSARLISFVLSVVVLSACGGDPAPAPPGPPTAIAGVSATSLSGVVATTLDSLRVRVTDADGRGVPGVSVDFRVTAGGGSIVAPPPPDTTQGGLRTGVRVISTTDGMGNASASWTLGTAAGTQTTTANVVGLSTITFTADADPDVPASWDFTGQSGFIGIAGQNVDDPLALRVVDQYNNGTGGVSVAWGAIGAGTSVAAASTTTDSIGFASVNATLGPTHGLHLYTAAPAGFTVDTIGILAVEGVSDPSGDAGDPGGAGLVAHDVTFFGGTIVDSILFVYFRFGDNVVGLPTSGGTPANSVVGIVEFDVDQDSTTGFQIVRQCIGGDPLGFGSDSFFDLNPLSPTLAVLQSPPPGTIPVLQTDTVAQGDPCAGTVFVIGVVPIYSTNTVTMFGPIGFLEDDGLFDVTSFMANGATFGITDIVPDSLGQSFDLSPVVSTVSVPDAAPRNIGELRYFRRPLIRTAAVRVSRESLREMGFRRR